MQTVAPFFTIIIPTFNRCAFVREAIASCLSQTFTDYEIIVIDDGSTDGTQEQLSINISGSIHYHFQENSGAEEARNRGITLAKGKYLVFLDSDDRLMPGALYAYWQLLQKTSATLLISKGVPEKADELPPSTHHTPTPVRYAEFKDYLSKSCPVWLSTSFIIINRQALTVAGVTFTKGTFPVDDLDFLLGAGTLSPCVIITSPATVLYRYHAGNSVKNINSNLDKLKHVLHRERSGFYPGGKQRSFDRLAIIGGHLQSWCLKGIRTGHFLKSGRLLLSGTDALCAIVIKKSLHSFLRRSTNPKTV